MKNIHLSIPENKFISLAIPDDMVFDELLAKAYIPGVAVMSSPTERSDLSVEFRSLGVPSLAVEPGRTVATEDPAKRSDLDLYHLLYGIARIKFLEQKLYPVHAALAGKTLIVGHSGAGKTAVMLKLISDFRFTFFSGNKTLVKFGNDGMTAIAGTETVTAKSKYQERYSKLSDAASGYQDRIAFPLAGEKAGGKISSIAIVRLNDGVEENTELEKLSALHKLHPFFLDAVNADTIMNGGNDVLRGDPPDGSREYLSRELARALKNIPVHSVSGTLEFVTKTISTL